jgi:predicted HTH domain antitoxin
MKTFKTTELADHVGDLVRSASEGELSVITQDGQPVFMTVPVSKEMSADELAVSLAVKLFDEDVITSREGARMAGVTLAEFLLACSQRGVPVVRYPPSELEMELANIQKAASSLSGVGLK